MTYSSKHLIRQMHIASELYSASLFDDITINGAENVNFIEY